MTLVDLGMRDPGKDKSVCQVLSSGALYATWVSSE